MFVFELLLGECQLKMYEQINVKTIMYILSFLYIFFKTYRTLVHTFEI